MRSAVGEAVRLVHTPFNDRVEDAVILTDAIMQDQVTVINVFSVPVENRDKFLPRWKIGVGVMAAQPGFIQAQMFRSLDPSAEFGFVTVARWASGAALAEARKNPEWRASVQLLMDNVGAAPKPMIYETALVVSPGEKP